MRLIDADALPLYEEVFMNGINKSGVWVRYRDVENLIRNAPTIEERKKGKWIVTGTFDDFLKCTCCGYKKPWNEDTFDFCPKCGAEMEDEDNGR